MPGLGSVLLSGLSGLRAAQTGLGVASQNIANANTPGYVRSEVVLAPRTQLGEGGGVEVAAIQRAADRFLAAASYIAEATRGGAAARADILDRAQASFGDPAGATSLFASLDGVWSALSEVTVDPSSTLRRSDAVSALQTMFSEVQRIGRTIQDLVAEADQRIGDAVDQAQDLINRVAQLNTEIRLSRNAGADASSAENAQSALIDQLSTLMDVRVSPAADGGVTLRTARGALLVGVEAAQIAYDPNATPFAAHGVIRLNEQLGSQANLEPLLGGGEIRGLLDVRDRDLAGLAESLGGFAAALADALNAVHNDNASSPPASSLVGRQTGLLATDALGFTGNAIIGVVDGQGVLRERLAIDFDARTIVAADAGTTFGFAAGTMQAFETALNAALGVASPAGTADFDRGVLRLDVPGGGLVIQQDSADPSTRAGRGFSHFFGLNDIASRPTPLFFESGLRGADEHGFAAGGALVYEVRDAAGRFVAQRTVTISGTLAASGADFDDLRAALNANVSGLGEFGVFTHDANTGRFNFAANSGYQVTLIADTTGRGNTNVSFSALNGLSPAATAARAIEIDVDDAIAANSTLLAVGRPDLSTAIDQRLIEAGDGHGVAALLAARDSVRGFPAAGVLSAQSATLAVYASRLGGEAGRLAADAQRAEAGAEAVAGAAADRRAQMEGVSLDDELMKMTTFQNAYAAAARVIQAATDMLDVLMSIGR